MSDEEQPQCDYQKFLNQLHTVKKMDDVEVLDSSDEFQMEKNETQYSQQNIYHSGLDEFVIPPKEQDSVSIDTKPYESTQIVKPKIQPVQLPPLSKKINKAIERKFCFKNVEINQQLLKYETVFYEIESYIDENDKALVIRQYSDFEWLFEELVENFPGIIIPSIPQKNMLAKFNITGYTNSIRSQRQKGLEEFLRKCLSHVQLKDCEIIEKFMTLQDQDFKKLVQNYQTQKQQKLFINVSKNMVVNAFGKIGNIFFNAQNNDNEMEKYCQIAVQEINIQKVKIKNIKDQLEKTFLNKFEQSKQFMKLSTLFDEIQNDIGYKEHMNSKCETISLALRDSFTNVMPIIYTIDQYLLDMEVVLNIVKYRADLQQLITDHAAALTSAKYTPEQQALIQTQLNDHQKNMSKFVENFKDEYEKFTDQYNKHFNKMMQTVLQVWQQINTQMQETWL
ncbi:unnamed protein product [Paramecium pentaurelia]|uniref:PX domain-containing protein n=1 Tax=Paramecium pentaurelia TaxID=43138 RepID=A0A8S1T3F8_9CILI|nr:unnamed protein product [Paramecium pentaurelia]